MNQVDLHILASQTIGSLFSDLQFSRLVARLGLSISIRFVPGCEDDEEAGEDQNKVMETLVTLSWPRKWWGIAGRKAARIRIKHGFANGECQVGSYYLEVFSGGLRGSRIFSGWCDGCEALSLLDSKLPE